MLHLDQCSSVLKFESSCSHIQYVGKVLAVDKYVVNLVFGYSSRGLPRLFINIFIILLTTTIPSDAASLIRRRPFSLLTLWRLCWPIVRRRRRLFLGPLWRWNRLWSFLYHSCGIAYARFPFAHRIGLFSLLLCRTSSLVLPTAHRREGGNRTS